MFLPFPFHVLIVGQLAGSAGDQGCRDLGFCKIYSEQDVMRHESAWKRREGSQMQLQVHHKIIDFNRDARQAGTGDSENKAGNLHVLCNM